jgi:hypothetical protein
MSDTSSSQSNRSNSENNNNINKKKVSYSTDYLPQLLQDSQKMVPLENRIGYQKNESERISERISEKEYIKEKSDNYSNSDKLSDYMTNDGENVNEVISNKYSNTQLYGNNKNTFFSQNTNNQNNTNQNITNENYKFTSNPNTNIKDEEKEKDKENVFNDDYDDYNELSADKQMLKRLDMLRKLGELAQYGVKLSQNYNMNSDYFAMKYECELHKNIRAKQNSVNWMSSLMLNCIYGIEILNEKYNPFDLKLKNWSEQINADINNYYDVFGEIYEKYNKPGKNMSPELKLVLMISGSALKFHLNNTLLSQPSRLPSQVPPSSINNNTDPKLLEQMRERAAYDKLREETQKNNDLLKEKIDKEHDLALKQMNDMMFLQKKKVEIQQQELEKQKKMEEFAKMKLFLEQKEINNRKVNINTSMNNLPINNPPVNNNVNKFDEIRRNNINQQLQNIKEKVKNMDIDEEEDDEPLYARATNIKKRDLTKDVSNTSTSSNTEKNTSSQEDTTTTSNKNKKNDKSISMSNSRRKYNNKKGITIQTN